MADLIRYDLLTQKALRNVVRDVLADVARKKVLPGEHHFYISFDTQAEGVAISPRLLAQYPEEMTIILQHQFWDMRVNDEGFEVGLSFGGEPERLVVPFEALNGFFDPSVQFGLQFEEVKEGGQDNARDSRPANALDAGSKPNDKSSDKFREQFGDKALRSALTHRTKTSVPPVAATQNTAPTSAPAARAAKSEGAKPEAAKPDADSPDAPKPKPAKPAGAEVVRLDRFRKK